MTSRDKDFRFMATHDLANELEKENFKLDQNAEPKLVTQLLKLLDDPANNVQENSVKWYNIINISFFVFIHSLCFFIIVFIYGFNNEPSNNYWWHFND